MHCISSFSCRTCSSCMCWPHRMIRPKIDGVQTRQTKAPIERQQYSIKTILPPHSGAVNRDTLSERPPPRWPVYNSFIHLRIIINGWWRWVMWFMPCTVYRLSIYWWALFSRIHFCLVVSHSSKVSHFVSSFNDHYLSNLSRTDAFAISETMRYANHVLYSKQGDIN